MRGGHTCGEPDALPGAQETPRALEGALGLAAECGECHGFDDARGTAGRQENVSVQATSLLVLDRVRWRIEAAHPANSGGWSTKDTAARSGRRR